MTLLTDGTIILGKRMCRTTILNFLEHPMTIKKTTILMIVSTMNLVDAVVREQSAEMKKIDHCLPFSLELEETLRCVNLEKIIDFVSMPFELLHYFQRV